ncbi:hypothetical protein Tco_1229843 [Tanacetum coccineum]
MKFEKDLFTYCVDNGVFQNFQDTSESSNDNTNVVNAPREPSVVDQDPGVNISQNPPQIDHNCCYECGDSLNGIFCQQCICESCGKGAHFGYNCPPKDPIISELEPCYNRNFDCFPHDSQTLPQQYLVCAYCGGPHFDYQCQPINQEYYNSHSSGFDQFQPPQFSDVYQTPPVASMEMLHAQTDLIEAMQDFLKKYDHIPHNEKSIKLLLAEEKFLKIKQVVEEEQTQPEYLQELLQSLLKDLQILNEIQPLKQEISNQIQKDQEEKSIAELLAEERLQKANQALNESQSPQEMRIQDLEIQKQQCLEEIKEWMNDLGIREYQKEEIDIDYRRKCEDKIYELKDKFNGLSIEIRKIIQEAEELRESEARARIQKIIIDDDDDNLGFYAVHPNTIHTPVSQNVEPKDSLIMGDGHINTTPETETISVETLVSNPSESDDFSLGECNLFDIDDSYYEKSTSRLAHLAPISPEIVEACVDDDDDSIPLGDIIARSKAITPDLPIEEPDNFLSMGDEHLDTIPSVEYLVPIPRESEGLSDNESECDMPSLSEEEIQKDEFNSFSNPLYDIDDEIITNESNLLSKKDLDEIILIPSGIDEPCFNAESDLLESLLNRDSPIDSTKTDSIFDEFSFPRLPEEHNSENVDTIIESLSYSPIPVEDSDYLMKEIDLFLTSDDSMPPGIESDDYDSEGDFRFLEELLINDSLPLPKNESYSLDSFDNPESPVVKSCFDFEPVAAVTNDFDVLNNDESFDSGEGGNVDSLNVEEEDSFTFTIRSFLPFVTYPEVLPASYSTAE